MDDEVIGCGETLLLHRSLQSDGRGVCVSGSSGAVDDPGRAKTVREIPRAEMTKGQQRAGARLGPQAGLRRRRVDEP